MKPRRSFPTPSSGFASKLAQADSLTSGGQRLISTFFLKARTIPHLKLVPQRHLLSINSLAPQNCSQSRVSANADVRRRSFPAANRFKERRDMRMPIFFHSLRQNRSLSTSLQRIKSSCVQIDSPLSSVNQSLLPASRQSPRMEKHLRIRKLHSVHIIVSERIPIHVRPPRRIVFPKQRSTEACRALRMAADRPVAHI